MGGVVNVITRQSRGKIGGTARIGGGSFGTSEFAGRVGGSVSSRVDFDVDRQRLRSARRLPHGQRRRSGRRRATRPTTARVRVGVDLGDGWRHRRPRRRLPRARHHDAGRPRRRHQLARAARISSDRPSDARLTGRLGAHDAVVHRLRARARPATRSNVTTTQPARPAVSCRICRSRATSPGSALQAKDSWNWSRRNSLVVGVDYEKVTSVSRSYARTGDRAAPFSADSNKRTAGVYAENTLKLRDGRTVVAVGGRVDRITTETVDTPLKTNFTPSDEHVHGLQPQPRDQARAGEGPARALRRRTRVHSRRGHRC